MRWPIDYTAVTRVGQGVMDDRGGAEHRPHKGVDIFAPAGTEVSSPVVGKVIRVVDGRASSEDSKRRAGLWVDIEETGQRRIHRLLHLGSADVKAGDRLKEGQRVGTVAEPNTSGLGDATHLHYEIRQWGTASEAYGEPIDPRPVLADMLADKAERIIPSMVRATGADKSERWAPIYAAVVKSRTERDPDKRISLARQAADAAMSQASLPGVAGKQAQLAQLLDIDLEELRRRLAQERDASAAAERKAFWQTSNVDRAVGRPRQYKLHIEEAERATSEADKATEDKQRKLWTARAIMEYRDARRAAGEDVKEGPSVVQTLKTAGKAAKETAKEAAQSVWEQVPTWAKVAGAAVLTFSAVSALSSLGSGSRRHGDEEEEE